MFCTGPAASYGGAGSQAFVSYLGKLLVIIGSVIPGKSARLQSPKTHAVAARKGTRAATEATRWLRMLGEIIT